MKSEGIWSPHLVVTAVIHEGLPLPLIPLCQQAVGVLNHGRQLLPHFLHLDGPLQIPVGVPALQCGQCHVTLTSYVSFLGETSCLSDYPYWQQAQAADLFATALACSALTPQSI